MGELTRDCLDPWNYIEVRSDGKVAPCCIRPPISNCTGSNIRFARRSDEHKALRSNLLNGDLDEVCKECHLKSLVPSAEFRQKILGTYTGGEGVLDDSSLELARISFTSDCNLRCLYCGINKENYDKQKISESKFEEALNSLDGFNAIRGLYINGHGEATFHPQWLPFSQRLLDKGLPLRVITNFATYFTKRELSTLAMFDAIHISIDTNDRDLLKKIRRKVDLCTVVTNMVNIRAKAVEMGRIPPTYSFLCGVFDMNVFLLEDFAWFASESGVSKVTFWNLRDNDLVEIEESPAPLVEMNIDDLRKSLSTIHRAASILVDNSIYIEFTGGFLESIHETLRSSSRSFDSSAIDTEIDELHFAMKVENIAPYVETKRFVRAFTERIKEVKRYLRGSGVNKVITDETADKNVLFRLKNGLFWKGVRLFSGWIKRAAIFIRLF